MHFHSDMAWQWEITLERWLRLHCIDTAGNQTNLWRDAPSQPDDITLLPFLLAQEVINECWLYSHEALSHKKPGKQYSLYGCLEFWGLFQQTVRGIYLDKNRENRYESSARRSKARSNGSWGSWQLLSGARNSGWRWQTCRAQHDAQRQGSMIIVFGQSDCDP